MQDEETECRRRNCFKGLLLQNPARLQHWEEMDLGYDIKCSEHESREVQNKVFVHGIDFQYHITGENMGILSPWATLGWEREGASLLQPCSDPAQGKPCCSPPTLCRVQGGCMSEVHSLSSRRCKQAVPCLRRPADRTARCAMVPFGGVMWSLRGYAARGAGKD